MQSTGWAASCLESHILLIQPSRRNRRPSHFIDKKPRPRKVTWIATGTTSKERAGIPTESGQPRSSLLPYSSTLHQTHPSSIGDLFVYEQNHLFIQQIFIEYPLCARHWQYSCEQTDKAPDLIELIFKLGEE